MEQAVRTARTLQRQMALQDAALMASWTMAHCRTVADVVDALDPFLSRLGVRRCFLGVDAAGEHAARLVLAYRDGRSEPAPDTVFPRHLLLPEALAEELQGGVLMLQAMSIAGRERGYLLYEPVAESSVLTEALRNDLPRTVDTVLATQELQDHAAMLERLVIERTNELARVNAELRRSAMRDGLTGLANRTAFQDFLAEAAPDVGEHRSLALMMVDVDMFKAYNDRYGHLAGDDALRAVATCLRRAVPEPHGLACRYGGEEFAVVLKGLGVPAAVEVARRFQELLAGCAVVHEASTVSTVVTASVGVAAVEVGPGFRATDLLGAADQALYRAKQQGRNRIVVAGGVPAVPRQDPGRRTAPAG
jgi:diguanylate cyclase (GGDEF)-like protein